MKPLLPTERELTGDISTVLKKSKTDLFRRIKRSLMQTTFSDRAKRALANSLTIEIKPSSLQVTAKHPAFAPLVMGQKSEQMTWLTKARNPIPIVTETGDLIFRSATAKSMRDGRWVHPGRKPSTFVEKAKEESREFLKKKFSEEIRKRVRTSFAKTAK
jgi:hypothetical protein